MRSPWSAPRVRVALRGDLGSADRGLSGLLGEWDDRGGVGAAARLPLREHNLTVDDHIELTEPAEPDLWCDAERAGKAIAKAHGLLADVASDEAALDLDVHGQSVTWCGRPALSHRRHASLDPAARLRMVAREAEQVNAALLDMLRVNC